MAASHCDADQLWAHSGRPDGQHRTIAFSLKQPSQLSPQPAREILCLQVGVALEHIQCLVPGDRSDLHDV